MVRLPIPSWQANRFISKHKSCRFVFECWSHVFARQEIEACRTYASEFERLEAKQMFRSSAQFGVLSRDTACVGVCW